jgi:hypothetical protein
MHWVTVYDQKYEALCFQEQSLEEIDKKRCLQFSLGMDKSEISLGTDSESSRLFSSRPLGVAHRRRKYLPHL